MPCVWEPERRQEGRHWQSPPQRLRVQDAQATNMRFFVIPFVNGGQCGACRMPQHRACWATAAYVLCPDCAQNYFGAPNLQEIAPELFSADAEDANYDDAPDNIITKRDNNFQPVNYLQAQWENPLSRQHGCAGYRCQTYAAPNRTIPANTPFMAFAGTVGHPKGHLCMACFAKLKAKHDAMPARVECPSCGESVAATAMRDTVRNGRVCRSCIDEYFINATETDGGYIRHNDSVWAMRNGQRVYASAMYAQRHWFQGPEYWFMTEAEADAVLYNADATYQQLVLSRHASSTPVFSYGTNVIKMHGFPAVTKKDSLCFGVELEMQSNPKHNLGHVVAALGGKWVAGRPYILCADSSLGSNGVEMITLPYTLADHKSDKYVQWTAILGELRKVAQSGQNTRQCGMHIHINRRALSSLQLGKMLVAVNAPEMQQLIVTIAQRSEAQYCHRYVKKVADGGKLIRDEAHGALSTSKNKGTAELRIFRGNLRYERVMKNLEFAEALCIYALEQSIQKMHDPAAMVEWIYDNKGLYPHLVKFIKEEYQPTKAFARAAQKARALGRDWGDIPGHVLCEPTEGDI